MPYKCKIRRQDKIIDIESAAEAPDKDIVEYFMEPMATCILVAPNDYLRDLKLLCEGRRGVFIGESFRENKTVLKYKLPMAEIITDFVDQIKSLTHGYGSFEYELADF